jgi:hypothetical protein
VGLPLLAWLLVCLKRRHRRKVEDRRAAASGFPTQDARRAGARSATPELWGPHQVNISPQTPIHAMLTRRLQHMHHTKGWEYSNDPAIIGGRTLTSSSKLGRKSKRESSRRSQRDQPEMVQNYDSGPPSRPSASRQQSAKGKGRATDEIMPVSSHSSHMTPTDRSRSRSQRRRDPDSDLERDAPDDSQHQRRLREVRGTQRRRDDLR